MMTRRVRWNFFLYFHIFKESIYPQLSWVYCPYTWIVITETFIIFILKKLILQWNFVADVMICVLKFGFGQGTAQLAFGTAPAYRLRFNGWWPRRRHSVKSTKYGVVVAAELQAIHETNVGREGSVVHNIQIRVYGLLLHRCQRTWRRPVKFPFLKFERICYEDSRFHAGHLAYQVV